MKVFVPVTLKTNNGAMSRGFTSRRGSTAPPVGAWPVLEGDSCLPLSSMGGDYWTGSNNHKEERSNYRGAKQGQRFQGGWKKIKKTTSRRHITTPNRLITATERLRTTTKRCKTIINGCQRTRRRKRPSKKLRQQQQRAKSPLSECFAQSCCIRVGF